MESSFSVLIIDDDPTHLRIYSWIMAAAGYRPLSALVTLDGVDFPDGQADIIVLDYRLSTQITAVEVAEIVRAKYPGSPILLMSDVYGLPADIAPFVDEFVRKGEPEKLVATLARLRPHAPAA